MLRRSVSCLVAGAALAACSSFNVVQPPEEGAIITVPAPTRVVIEGKPSMSNVLVRANGADVSNQVSPVTSSRSEGNLNLAAGRHTIDVEANVPCWYCTGQTFRHSQQRKVCVVAPGPLAGPSMTAVANAAGSRSWSTASASSVVAAPDTGANSTRWAFRRLGGFASSVGIIESVEFPCRCLRSTEDTQNAPIGLAMCDANDATQQWQSLQATGGLPANNLRFQNNGRGISSACLTEGPAPDRVLIQRNCLDTPEQVWRIRDNTTGQFVTSPW